MFPFILVDVSLLGIDWCRRWSLRIGAWCPLASELPIAKLDAITTLEPLSKVEELSEKIWPGRSVVGLCSTWTRKEGLSDFTGSGITRFRTQCRIAVQVFCATA